jgi:hypothetical protein
MKGIKIVLLLFYGFFSYLLLLISLQYVPLNFEVPFLKLKQEEIQLWYYNVSFFIHVYTSFFLLAVGILQFSKRIRLRKPTLHKLFGKLYVFIILFLSGPSALVMSYYANGGLVSKTAFLLLTVLWILFTFLAFQSAVKLDFVRHQKFVIRSFALTLSAISLRLFKYIIVFLFHPLPMDTYRIVSWLGWIFNLIIAEIIIIYLFRNKLKKWN